MAAILSRLKINAKAQHEDNSVPKEKPQSYQNIDQHDRNGNTNRWSMEASLHCDESVYTDDVGQEENKHGKSKYDWSIKLDKSGEYLLEWTILYPENKIIFALNINQTGDGNVGERRFRAGWDIFALGFSKDGHLASSDFCIIWYDLAHRIHLQDAKTDSDQRLELIDSSSSFCSLISSSSQDSRSSSFIQSKVVGAFNRKRLLENWSLKHRSLHGSVKDSRIDEDKVRGDDLSVEVDGGDGREKRGGEKDEVGDQRGRLGEVEGSPEESLDKQGVQIVFSRPLDVCSRTDYYQIDNGTTHLVWFSLTGPVLTIDGLDLGARSGDRRKGTRLDNNNNNNNNNASDTRLESGFRRVQLIASKLAGARKAKASKPNSDRIHEVRMKEFPVPARDTLYWCKLFRLPRKFQKRKHHITSYQALIEPASNEHIVHHMELFHCATKPGSGDAHEEEELVRLYKTGGWAGECGASDRPPATKLCRRVLLAWAMGAKPLIYPEQVGQAIGGGPPESNFGQFVVLEVHYNNPSLIGGLVDSSGLRFHYTHQLRPNEAGVMEVGLEYTDKNSIPPGVVAPLAGYCTGECTRLAIGSSNNQLNGGIYVFAGQLHTHLAGVASWTEHYRAGKLLGELQRDNHYSPHFQEIRLLPEPVRLEPGDTLVHYCLYDTRNRTKITLGGFATTDEMCVTYLHYYPKIDLEVCKSSVDSEALEDYFEYLSKEEAQSTGSSRSVSDNYRAIGWSAHGSRELLEFYANAPLSVQCNRSNGDRFAGSWTGAQHTHPWPSTTSGSSVKREPLWRRDQPILDGARLMGYRGIGFGRRHAQCDASSEALSEGTAN